jgi:CBS domain-containing protein
MHTDARRTSVDEWAGGSEAVHATVSEVMTRRVVAATEGAEFKQIAAMMRENRVSALPVVDSQNRGDHRPGRDRIRGRCCDERASG